MATKMSDRPEEPGQNPQGESPRQSQTGGRGGGGIEDPDAVAAVSEAEEQQAEMAAVLAGVPGDLLALRDEVEKLLMDQTGDSVQVQDLEAAGIVGVGIGMPGPEDLQGELGRNLVPGQAALNVYTVDRLAEGQVLTHLARAAGTHALSALPVRQIPTGVIDAFSHRARLRPSPGGISVGHVAVTAGTLGSRAIGLNAPWNNRHLLLSNNHVLANSNAARVSDAIVQPGTADGGRAPADQIAVLAKWVPINFASGAVNYVDCAVGWAWSDRIRGEQMWISGGTVQYYKIGNAPVPATLGTIVGKSGRTTQLTQGRVIDIGASVTVNFGGGRVALFRDQLSIRSTGSNPFSAGGDSGSVIWRWDNARPPVGLLFAGGGGITYANKMWRVLSALDIRLLP